MGIAGGLATHRPQAKALGGIKAGGFHATVVKRDHFRTPPLEKKLAIVHAIRGFAQEPEGAVLIQRGFKRAESV